MSATRWRLKIAVGVLGVLLLGVAAYNSCRVYCCAPMELTLSGGNVCPLRSEMAQYICREIHEAGVVLRCAAASNSESIEEAVDRHALDLGLVLGGIPADRHPNVRQVAALGVDPLHLLVRRELVRNGSPALELLRGRRVALGELGTNGARLAERLLQFAGLRPSTAAKRGDFIAEYPSENDLHLLLTAVQWAAPADRPAFAARLPDAVFLVDSVPAPLVDELVATGDYQLLPLPYATALHLDNRRNHGGEPGTLDHDRLVSSRLEAVTIPAYAYGIDPPVPAVDCPTFGLRLLMVANKDTPATGVLQLLRALDGRVAKRFHLRLDTDNHHSEFPVHPGAADFAHGRRPLAVNEMLEPAGDLLSILGAGGAGALAVWGFLRGLRAVSADVHLRQIDRIERLLAGREQDESAPREPCDFIEYLEGRLAEVKEAAIEDYASGRLSDDDALVSVLTLVADTRHLLARRRKQLAAGDPCPPLRESRYSEAA